MLTPSMKKRNVAETATLGWNSARSALKPVNLADMVERVAASLATLDDVEEADLKIGCPYPLRSDDGRCVRRRKGCIVQGEGTAKRHIAICRDLKQQTRS